MRKRRAFTGFIVVLMTAIVLVISSCNAGQKRGQENTTGVVVQNQGGNQTAQNQQTPISQQTPVSLQTPVSQQTPAGQKSPSSQQSANQKGGKFVELVICIDTSNSMDQLIDSAKQKLWDIVNTVASMKPTPKLRVALLSYGNDGYNSEKGWIRLESDFTGDLDLINEKLFGLRTNGGTEYVTGVINEALKNLSWNKEKKSLRMIFVAGNESALQDPRVSAQSISGEAAQHSIIINTIYCGGLQDADAGSWKEVAAGGGGSFFAIDAQSGTVVINTPYDKKLAELSNELNTTYIAYGPSGGAAMANQAKQDANAQGMSDYAAASRAKAKSSAVYENSEWDLVDASKQENFKVREVKKENLPAPMQTMSEKEQKDYIATTSKKREDINKKIKELSSQRDEYIKNARKGKKEKTGFDEAVLECLEQQAENKGFTVAK